ncbi:restriction endonuclease [Alicyclobacillus dauci]|uniref:Restriction endonuclease n=1 Tax=Alicyclobacillus dauci TaxID=1475485 RepID=A0ABY6Z918_9BACL|nr:restriction endonuclease [Alicyclobacillus dauci]WAH39033.1 restriction endonuclease [Alicyclobacillus dauci]
MIATLMNMHWNKEHKRFEEERRKHQEQREQQIALSRITDVDQMSGLEFEEYLRVLFSKMGYDARTTRASGDFGADVVLTDQEGQLTVVQAKRYSKPVGVKAVQEVHGAKGFYQAEYAIVVTNSSFTKAARDLALKLNVRLIDRHELTELGAQVWD